MGLYLPNSPDLVYTPKGTPPSGITENGLKGNDHDRPRLADPRDRPYLAPLYPNADSPPAHSRQGNPRISADSRGWQRVNRRHCELVDRRPRLQSPPILWQKSPSKWRPLPHVMFGGLANEQAYRLATRLAAITPGDLTRVFLSESGFRRR